MTEMNQEIVEQSNIDVVDEQGIDYKSMYEEVIKKFDVVVAHKDKLYQETKAAKAEREAAKQEAQRIEQEKAVRDGEFEKLWQSTEQEKKDLINRLHDIESANKNEKIQIASLKVANELADGDNVELLSTFVQQKIAALADDSGKVAPDVIEAVVQEFKNNQKFKALLRGSKAAGGGAPGASHSVQDSKTITRSTFEQMGHSARQQFFSKGGKLTDE